MSKDAAWVGLVIIALLGVGCGSKEAVSLSGEVETVQVTVEQTAVGTFLSGEFVLVLRLGKYASESATVESSTFILVDAEERVDLGLDPLSVTPEVDFPFDVSPGDRRSVHFSIDARDPLAVDAIDELCAEAIALSGTIRHSLDGGSTTSVRSPPVLPEGCP